MPGVMIHRMQDLYGELFINYIFYSTQYNQNSINQWRCIISNRGLEGQFIRIYNASGSDSLRGISSKQNIIMSDGQVQIDGMGMYDNLINNKPGSIYLLNDFKTGGRSYAILLYGCFVILDEE